VFIEPGGYSQFVYNSYIGSTAILISFIGWGFFCIRYPKYGFGLIYPRQAFYFLGSAEIISLALLLTGYLPICNLYYVTVMPIARYISLYVDTNYWRQIGVLSKSANERRNEIKPLLAVQMFDQAKVHMIDFTEITIGEKIGSGSSSIVWKASYKKMKVAVKEYADANIGRIKYFGVYKWVPV